MKSEVDKIYNELKIARDFYYKGNPIMSDADFDSLEELLRKIDPEHFYFQTVGSPVDGKKIRHKNPMGSLTQLTIDEFDKILENSQIVISEKLDGCSVSIYYGDDGNVTQALSRGDGYEGVDITRHILKISDENLPKISEPNSIVRGEVIMRKDLFNESLGYKNARNYVAGQLNSKETSDYFSDNVSFMAFDMNLDLNKTDIFQKLSYYGFKTPRYRIEDSFGRNLEMLLAEFKKISLFEIDGLVVEFNDANKRNELGFSKLNPNFSFKFKVNVDFYKTIVDEIIWSSSADGYLKPRVKFEPIDINGVTVTYATGFNAKFIKDNKLGKGSEIEITRSGDVIPHITNVISSNIDNYDEYFDVMLKDYQFHWSENDVDIIMNEKNKEANIKEIVKFFESISAPYLKIGNVTKLFDNGFTTIASIINADKTDFDFIGENGKKIYEGLKKKLNPIEEYILAGSFPGFGRGIGVTRMKTLAERYGIIKTLTHEEILNVDGFDEKTARLISDNIPLYLKFIDEISKNVKIKYFEKSTGKFSGYKVCFTGVRSKDLERKIIENGGEISNSVTRLTTHLVADDIDGNSVKLQKARERNLIILNIEDAEEFFNV